MPKNAITYLRVSTRRQGASGLGIDAQRAAVETFCRDHGYRVVEEFKEIESGRHSDRPVCATRSPERNPRVRCL
jgi:DNA invertase Pin-like site-specific DNA recombinase